MRPLRWLLLAALVLLVVGLPQIADAYTDWLWFGEVGYRQVFVTEFTTRGGLWAAALLVGFAVLTLNLEIALRAMPLSPVLWVGQPAMPVTLPGRPQLRRGARLAAALVSLPLAFRAGAEWLPIQLWLHRAPFGHVDPVLGYDIGFYIFTLPVLEGILSWLFALLAFSAVASGIVYFLAGRIAVTPRAGLFVAPEVRRHLAILVAAVFALLAVSAWIAPANLLLEPSGLIFGASYADVAVRIPAARVLFVVCLVCIGLAVMASRRALSLLVVAVGLYVATVALSGIIATAVQRFVVGPNEQVRETPYMANNIAATQKAFGLDRVEEKELTGDATLGIADIVRNHATLSNVRLWDHQPLLDTFAQLQEIRPYYDFASVDNDRYTIDGDYRQVMLSARELNTQALSNRTWINEHLTFTHGYGLTLGPVNQVTAEGLPELFVKDLPPVSTTDLRVTEPRIYFGELSNDYVLVGTRAPEFDYPRGEDNVTSHYEGQGGVLADSAWRKLLFALRFRAQQILFSDDLTPGTRVIFHRRISDRLEQIAPFLRYEGDPYLVVADGRLYWMEDAYTTSDSYPYSTPATSDVNYIRNSVKVVVDAYHGTTTFYLADETDPIAQAMGRVFPGMMRPLSSMPGSLKAHIRYPHTLFTLQTAMFATYHMTNPAVFYNKEDQWELPSISDGEDRAPMQPYYTIMTLPGETRSEFIQMVPLTPRRKDNLAAWMAAESDAPHYGRLMVFRFPKQKVVFGPRQVVSRINQDQAISPQITLWNQQGSEVIQGTLLVIPVEESLLYIRPLYLRSQGGRIPELKRVIVAYQGSIVMEPTLELALDRLFGQGAAAGPPPSPGTMSARPAAQAPVVSEGLRATLEEAKAHFDRATAAQRAGDWATYGEEIKRLGEILARTEPPPAKP